MNRTGSRELESLPPKKSPRVATARCMNRPKYHALIDSGALVTGMSNLEVAQYLLQHGLEGLDGVLFLNERNERVVLERDSMKIIELAENCLGSVAEPTAAALPGWCHGSVCVAAATPQGELLHICQSACRSGAGEP
eukprot:s2830_g2.t1